MLESNPNLMRPRCSRCGAAMEQASVIPGLGALAPRIFQCGKCGHVELLPETQPNGNTLRSPVDTGLFPTARA
jgi:hypothetical protein